MSAYIGRFAPSPTGPLHAGSVATALASWLDARAHKGRWLIRIEDIDTLRTVPGATDGILQTLQALGLTSDEPVVRQSERSAFYQAALQTLTYHGLTYPCACSRKEIADSALQQPAASIADQGLIYPGTCRGGLAANKMARAIRFKVPDKPIHWVDRRLGPRQEDLQHTSGDFVIKRADGPWAYQLAVVVDDQEQGITHIVRGEDLVDSTGRQIALQRALGYPSPSYLHVPVVLAEDGEKLSKQNGAVAIDSNQPIEVLNAAARHLGIPTHPCPNTDSGIARWLEQAIVDWKRLFTHAAQ